jgi:hypothetical protein
MGAPMAAYYRVFELAKAHTDAEIADALNAEGLLTMKRKPWCCTSTSFAADAD